MTENRLQRLREICLALPEAREEPGRVSVISIFKVREKAFVRHLDNHHGDGRLAIWCKAPPGEQAVLVASDPTRFFVPPYVGPKGWIGLRLDVGEVDWAELAEIVEESYRMTAPKRLIAALDAQRVSMVDGSSSRKEIR
jgi:hypothetical protein